MKVCEWVSITPSVGLSAIVNSSSSSVGQLDHYLIIINCPLGKGLHRSDLIQEATRLVVFKPYLRAINWSSKTFIEANDSPFDLTADDWNWVGNVLLLMINKLTICLHSELFKLSHPGVDSLIMIRFHRMMSYAKRARFGPGIEETGRNKERLLVGSIKYKFFAF